MNLTAPESPSQSVHGTRPPVVLLLVAALCISSGAAALVESITSFFTSHLDVNLGILAIPIGRGLLRGSSRSRDVAVVVAAAGLVLMLVVAGVALFSGKLTTLTAEQVWMAGAQIGVWILALSAAAFGLRTSRVKAWLDTENQASQWTMPLMAVGILFASSAAIQEHFVRTSVGEIFAINTRFEFRDARTGQPITTSIDSSGVEHSKSGSGLPLEPKLGWGSIRSGDALGWKISGVSGRPYELTFRAEGYRAYPYTIDRKTPPEVVLELEPLSSDAAQ